MSFSFDFVFEERFFNLPEGSTTDLSPNKDGGIIKHLVKHGEGDFRLNFNDYVSLLYIAYNGEVAPEYIFDSSERDGKTFDFHLGRGEVIRGFEYAVMTMKKGEHAIIYLKPEYAYGRGGAPPKIPENTVIIFDTKILVTEGEDFSVEKDKSMVKHILERGQGFSVPNEGCLITIDIEGWHGDRKFDDRKGVTFPYGEGPAREYKIPRFVETILKKFRVNEKTELQYKSHKAYKDKGFPEFGIPPDADLRYIVRIYPYERVKDFWEMDNTEKMDQSDRFKEQGTFYYKRGEFVLAKKFYKKMLDNVEYDYCMQGEEEKRRRQIYTVAYSNLAMAYIKLKEYVRAREACDKVLEMNMDVKALFRRGEASFQLKRFEESKEDFEGVLEIEPDNKAARKRILLCTEEIRKAAGNDKELAQRMMSQIGKGKGNDLRYGSGMNDIGDWDNSMAHGMMTLEQEREAFGDPIPQLGGNNHGMGGNNHGTGGNNHGIGHVD